MASAASETPLLPSEVLEHIASFINPLRARVRICSLVSKRWRAAVLRSVKSLNAIRVGEDFARLLPCIHTLRFKDDAPPVLLRSASALTDLTIVTSEFVNEPFHPLAATDFKSMLLHATELRRLRLRTRCVLRRGCTAEHYTSILRRLFGLGEHWNPPAPLARALRCIEGPPRLLLTFLWAVQASGTPHAAAATPPSASAATAAYDAMFTTDIDCELLRPKLSSFSWPQSVAVLNRCLGALDHSRLVTFTDKIKHGSDCLELFHNIAALFLLSQPVSLDTKLDTSITVNDVIADGFALVQPIEGQKGMHLLRWPRIYIWALAKWCGSKIDGLPLPAAAAALTPSPRMNDAEEAWRYNEDADIKLLCLRLFAHQQRACTLPAQVGGVVRLGELLPCLADHAPALAELVVRLATRHVVRAELSEPLRSDTLLELLAQSSTILPFAAINKDKTPYADSILLLQLDTPAPRACCPSKIAAGDRLERQYKEIAPQHQKTLAVLLQSKHHSGFPTRSEAFGEEYAKCIDTPIPFVFILISDAPNVAYQQHINWPYNGNGFFVGRNELRHFYGEVLFGIRAESWLAKDTP